MKFISLIILFILSFSALSQDGLTIVAVGEAELEKQKIIIERPYIGGSLTTFQLKKVNEIRDLFVNDFRFYKKYFNVTLEASKVHTNSFDSVKWSGLTAAKAEYLLSSNFQMNAGKDLSATFILYKTSEKKELFKKTVLVDLKKVREQGHYIADQVYQSITGKESIFTSKIVFVSDERSRGRNTIKEVYIVDFDGKNRRRLTFHNQITISPALSHDGSKLLYSLIKEVNGIRNVDLYLMDLNTKKTRMLSNRKGINSGAVFLPGDKKILLTLSYSGNAEIYEMNISNKSLRKITHSYSADVDPSINQDASLLTFLSDRSGKAMIYTADPKGKEKMVKRISFVGRFNATPRFSPDGRYIVFSSWVDNLFDIYRIDSSGRNLARLTKNFGSNEDPSFSPDGEFVTFSSQRVISRKKAHQNIYIMDKDGEILGAITEKFGKCQSPRWSK